MLNVFVSLYSVVVSIGTEEAEAKKKNDYKYLLIQGSEDNIILLSDTLSKPNVGFYNNTNTKTKV